jgi:hypothetical protein
MPALIRSRLQLATLVLVVSCSRGGGLRFVDTRLDTNIYFIQEVWPAGLSKRDVEARKQSFCHGVTLTLDAGYDYYVAVPTGRPPDVPLHAGEEVVTATIKMFKGSPAPGNHSAIDAHLLQQVCR